MRRFALAALGLIAFALPAFGADNATLITPCASGCVTVRARDVGAGVQSMIQIPGDTAGNALATAPGVGNGSFALPVQGVTGGVSLSVLLSAETTKVIGTVNQGTSPWVVSNGGTFAVQAGQTGTWNITNISGTISLPTGAATAAKQPAIGTAGTASVDVITIQGIAAMTPLLVNPGTAANWGIGATGAAVPANAVYLAINSGGNLTGWNGAVTNAGTFAVQAAQAAAANLNATVVGTGTFAVQATLQASSATAIGTVNPTTIATWGLVASSQNVAAPTNTLLGACQFTTAPTTIATTNVSPLQCDNAANLLVDIKAGTVAATQSGTWNIGTLTSITNALPAGPNVIGHVIADTGSTTAVTQATASNLNATVVGTGTFAVQATLQASSATAIGTVNPTTIASWGLLSGTAPGTAPTNTMIVGGKYNLSAPAPSNGQTLPLQQDSSGNLYVNVAAGGASGGTSSTFTAAFPATGTAAGMSQGGNMVALTGTTGNLNVQCANCSGSGVSTVDEAAFTGGTSVFVGTGGFFQTTATNNALTTGQQGMQQMTASRAGFVNLRNAAGTEVGTAGTPLQVSVANTAANGTAILVTGTGGTFPISGALTANQSVNEAQINGVTPLMGNGVTGTGSQRVTIASDNTAFSVNATLQTSANVIGSLTANQSVNVAQFNGVTPLMGNGVSGTGSQRVNIASDNTAFSVNATLQASSATAIGTVNPTTAANWGIVTQGSTTSGQSGVLNQAAVTTAAPSYTTAQTSPLSLTLGGSLRTDNSSQAGTVLGAPSNYGTSPGAVAVPGVNAFVTNTPSVNLASAATGGCTNQTPIFTAASNNATVIGSAAAHTLCEFSFDNTTTSVFSIRFYDTATAPSAGAPCNSATNLAVAVVAQSNANSPGRAQTFGPFGRAFASGMVVCITGVNAANDNTNAVTGGNFNVSYK